MAVTKELLQMDLYALLGIEEKAADKEVRTVVRRAESDRAGGPSCLGASPAAGTAFQVRPGPGRGVRGGPTASEGGFPDVRFLAGVRASRRIEVHTRKAPYAGYCALPMALV